MNLNRSFRTGLAALAIVGVATVVGPAAQAQGFGGGGMPPEIAAKIKLWQKWRESHKNLSTLQTMMYQVRELDKDPSTQLTKPQATKMIGILKNWRSKPMMSEDQAKDVSKQIGAMLSEKQLKKMSTIQPAWARGGGGGMRPGGGGGMRPGGAGGAGGFKFPDPPAGGYNPLNPDTLPFVQQRPMMKQSLDTFVADLHSRK